MRDGLGDPYAVPAEFYDVVTREHWESFGPRLEALLAGVDPRMGPVVDLGAGTGLSTRSILNAVPDADVVAIEPSPSMRAVLRARFTVDREASARVTVDPRAYKPGRLPRKASAIVAVSMLGHLPEPDRSGLLKDARSALPAGGLLVVELQPPPVPMRIEPTLMATGQLGTHRYEGWCRAEPDGDDTMLWHMTYKVFDQTTLVDERTFETVWWTVSRDGFVLQARAEGFVLRSEAAGLLRFTAPS